MLGGQLIKQRYSAKRNFLEESLISFLYWSTKTIYINLFRFFPYVHGIVLGGSFECPYFKKGVSDLDISVYFESDVPDKVLRIARLVHKVFTKLCPIIEPYCIPITIDEFKKYISSNPEYLLWYEINRKNERALKGDLPHDFYLDIKTPVNELERIVGYFIRGQWLLMYEQFQKNEVNALTLFNVKKIYYKVGKINEYVCGDKFEGDFLKEDVKFYFDESIHLISKTYLYFVKDENIKVELDESIFYQELPIDIREFINETGLSNLKSKAMQPFYGFHNEIFIFYQASDVPSFEFLQNLKNHRKKYSKEFFIYFVAPELCYMGFSSMKKDDYFYDRFLLDFNIDALTASLMNEVVSTPHQKSYLISSKSAKQAYDMILKELIFFRDNYLLNDEILYLRSEERDKMLIKAKHWLKLGLEYQESKSFRLSDINNISIEDPKMLLKEIESFISKSE